MFDKTHCRLLKIQKIPITKGFFADISQKNIATLFGSDIIEVETLLCKLTYCVVLHPNRGCQILVLIEQSAAIDAIEDIVWNL